MSVIRKYSIFISSCFKDLQKHRNEISEEILKIEHIPIGMESFYASDTSSLNVIEDKIKKSDIFILLVGARLGSKVEEIENKNDIETFIQWEYNKARELKKPILVFMLNIREYREKRREFLEGDIERKYDTALENFRKIVQETDEGGNRIVEFFSSEDVSDLRGKVSTAISKLLQRGLEGGGWVPGRDFDNLSDRVMFSPVVSKNPFFSKFAQRFNDYEKLSEKTLVNKELKIGISKYLWFILLHIIDQQKIYNLYFDSGSSIAYLSEELISSLSKSIGGRTLQEKIQIYTNNLLTFLDFTLMDPQSNPINMHLLPKAPTESDYGATYGRFTRLVHRPAPRQPMPLSVDVDVDQSIKETKNTLLKSLQKDKSLIFMAASGLEMREDNEFKGPHVGSFYNQLVKRSLLETEIPIVLVLDETKFQKDFIPGTCYPICDSELEWETILESRPIALALAATTKEKIEEMIDPFHSWGLNHTEPITEKHGVWPMVAMNDLFYKWLYSKNPS